MEEINEIDFNKYLVLKQEDIDNELSPRQKANLASMQRTIGAEWMKKGKKYTSTYIVLNIDDNISLAHLNTKLTELIHNKMLAHMDLEAGTLKDVVNSHTKVRYIAVDILNAIMKTKDEKEKKRD